MAALPPQAIPASRWLRDPEPAAQHRASSPWAAMCRWFPAGLRARGLLCRPHS